MDKPKDPVVRAEDGTLTVELEVPIFQPSPELIALVDRRITERLEPIREEIAGLRKRAEACEDMARASTDEVRVARLRGKAHGYRHSAEVIEAALA